MEIKIYDYLHKDVIDIREKVFMKEQGFVVEFDDIDQMCTFVVLYDNHLPIATCRFFKAKEDTYTLGRVAVLKEYRNQNIGRRIVEEAEEYIRNHARYIELSAQVRVRQFYEKMGYQAEGKEYLDEYCPHIHMIKEL